MHRREPLYWMYDGGHLLYGRLHRRGHGRDELWCVRECVYGKDSGLLRRRLHRPGNGREELWHVRDGMPDCDAELLRGRLHQHANGCEQLRRVRDEVYFDPEMHRREVCIACRSDGPSIVSGGNRIFPLPPARWISP